MVDLAIVGCGYWGPNLARNFNSLADCRVTVLCDTDPARLQHMKRLYPGVDSCLDYEEVLDRSDVDAVAIATPTRLHYPMAAKALDSGRHVLVEKPLTTSVQECESLLEMAEDKSLILMVGHTFLYSPTVRKIREIIQQGDLGELQYVSARRLNLGLFQTDINVAWDLAPHDISIILYILDEMPVGVNCQGKAHVTPGIEDVTNMTLTFGNGAFALIHNSWLDPNKIRQMTFVGRKRMLAYDDIEPFEKIRIYDKRVEVPPHYDSLAEFQFSYHQGDMYSPSVKQTESLNLECQHFIDCIKTGVQPESSGAEGLQVVQVLDAASQSLKNNGAKVELSTARRRVRAAGPALSLA